MYTSNLIVQKSKQAAENKLRMIHAQKGIFG